MSSNILFEAGRITLSKPLKSVCFSPQIRLTFEEDGPSSSNPRLTYEYLSRSVSGFVAGLGRPAANMIRYAAA